MQLILFLLVPVVLGAAAGWFLASWLVIALTVIAGCAMLLLGSSMGKYPGTSADLGTGVLQVVIAVFSIAMLIACAVSSGWFHPAMSVDWSWIRKLLFK